MLGEILTRIIRIVAEQAAKDGVELADVCLISEYDAAQNPNLTELIVDGRKWQLIPSSTVKAESCDFRQRISPIALNPANQS